MKDFCVFRMAFHVTRSSDFEPLCSLFPFGICRGLHAIAWESFRAVPEIILGVCVGCRYFFVLWGEGVLLTTCQRGGGGVNLSWGSRCIWSIVGGVIEALTYPGGWGVWFTELSWGLGALTPCVSWGWRGLKKMWAPPRIPSGTALRT